MKMYQRFLFFYDDFSERENLEDGERKEGPTAVLIKAPGGQKAQKIPACQKTGRIPSLYHFTKHGDV